MSIEIPTTITKNFTAPTTELQDWVEKLLKTEQEKWVDSLKPQPDAFGLRRLPRDPNNPDRFLPTFKTDKHTYTILGETGIGIERYTIFQKRSLQRGFARDFQQLYDELQKVQMTIGGESNVGKLRTESIIHLKGIQDSVADFGKEQFDAGLWLCTLFILREDENVSSYSEQIAEEKIKDWAAYGFSELDFFLLSGSCIPGYGVAYNAIMEKSEAARKKFLDVTVMNGAVALPAEVTG